MEDLSLVRIFFILTGTAVIIITILLAIGLLYLIMFLRTVRQVARTAQQASEIISEDISELRDSIKEKGMTLGAIAKFAKGMSKQRILSKKK